MRKKEKWIETRKGADFARIGEMLGIDPAVIRIARNRGMVEDSDFISFFDPKLSDLHDPSLFKDANKAADIITEKIKSGSKIRIIGDYDIDGVCSTYILMKGLMACNAQCDYAVPHRIEDGYGLNEKLITDAHNAGNDTIITCDNGIAASKEIEFAKNLGMTVIVTDHHEVPLVWEGETSTEILPPADAVVDPKRTDCQYPFKGICGAVVAWKLVKLIMERFNRPIEEWMSLIDAAAFATIGDVMELKDENRAIVKHGLLALEKTANFGFRALMAQTGMEGKSLSGYHIGFVMGPCLNATGRLDSAMRAVELLLSDSIEEATPIAVELVSMNNERKDLTMQGVELAKKQVEEENLVKDDVLVIYLPGVHESLAGIIAGKIREAYYRPVFVLTDGENCAKGSGRSIDEFSMYEHMSKIGDVFLKFGGHPKAAGLSIESDRIDEFRRRINENTGLTEDDLVEKRYIDIVLPPDYISERMISDLQRLEPCGNGNEKPMFAVSSLPAKSVRRMGKDGQHIKITLRTESGHLIDAVLFNGADELLNYYREKYSDIEVEKLLKGENSEVRFSLIYYPDVNEFQGRRNIQLQIKSYC